MLVSCDWLAQHLHDRNLVLLHVGAQRGGYEAGHIPGALFLPMSAIAVTRNGAPNELPTIDELRRTFAALGVGAASRIVIYGEESGVFAARAWFTLDYMGLGGRASLLDGGMELWRRSRAVDRAPSPTPKAGRLVAAPHAELVALLPMVRQASASRSVPIVDARSREMFERGRIEGAVNIYWADLLASRETPTLLPVAVLRQRFVAAGLRPGARVIVYCNTGMQASYDYFMLKLSGYRPVLYDASYYEWSRAAR